MAEGLTDKTGVSVTVGIEIADPISAYTVAVDGESPIGRAEYVDSPGADDERIFFHTEVDPAFEGRGLAGLLLGEALADSIRNGRTVVPVCPLFARHLKKHGDEFVAAGGVFRAPTRADISLIARLARRRS
jgi:uncharacterized protein